MKKILLVLCAAAALGFAACSNDSDSPSYVPTPAPSPAPSPEPSPSPSPTPTTSYTITVEESANGTVTSDKASAKKGETVTLTIAPNEGFALVGLTATSGTHSATVKGSGATRTFEMLDGKVTVKGTFCAVVTLGEWPQTIKANDVQIDEGQTKIMGGMTYYKGSDGAWYAKQTEKAHFAETKYSDGSIAGHDGTTEKYFKVEPIVWRVVTSDYGGKKLLMSQRVLAPCIYYDTMEDDRGEIHPNNYKESKVRAYLNGLVYNKSGSDCADFEGKGFLQGAFSAEDQAKIQTVSVDNSSASTTDYEGTVDEAGDFACDNTEDKVFLLSLKEATNPNYSFAKPGDSTYGNTRVIIASDFAIASGVALSLTEQSGGAWLLRSPVKNTTGNAYGFRLCEQAGKIVATSISASGSKASGVVPVICVNP